MVGAIALRHSQRSPFSSRAVGAEALDELRRAAQAEGAWLAVVHRRNDQLALTVLLARADREETDNAAYGEELASWLRTDPAPDGIPVQVYPPERPRPPHPVHRIRPREPDRARTGQVRPAPGRSPAALEG